LGYLYTKKRQNRNHSKLISKYLREGYILRSEVEKIGRENEEVLIGLGKTRKLALRMEERLKA